MPLRRAGRTPTVAASSLDFAGDINCPTQVPIDSCGGETGYHPPSGHHPPLGRVRWRTIGGLSAMVVFIAMASAGSAAAQSVQPKRSGGPTSSVPAGAIPARPPSQIRPADRLSVKDARRAAEDPGVVRAGGATRVAERTDTDGVVQAGASLVSVDCRRCGRRGCNECRTAGGRLGLPCNGRCEAGGCPAHCPVKPDQFGYYATRWRNWPGQGVRQVSHFDPATTPVVPPRSMVPPVEEEATIGPEEPGSGAEDEAAAADDGNAEKAPDGESALPVPAADAPGTSLRRADRSPAGLPPDDRAAPAPTEPDTDLMSPPADVGGADGDADSLERLPVTPPGDVPKEAAPGSDGAGMGSSNHPSNPLRRTRFPGLTASASGDEPSGTPDTQGARRRSASDQWRPSRRAVPAGDIAVPLLRGVTANPGNPLR